MSISPAVAENENAVLQCFHKTLLNLRPFGTKKSKMRNYVNKSGKTNKKHHPEHIASAVAANGDKSIRQLSLEYGISYSTLRNHIKNSTRKRYGGQTVLSEEEEAHLTRILVTCADWHQPLKRKDVLLIVQNYLNALGKRTRFKDNKPGRDWWKLFLKRNPILSEKFGQNIKRCRAAVTEETLTEYFKNLEKALEGVPSTNVINYDETNFTDDPGAELVIGRRGARHMESVKDTTKTSTSVMFSCTAAGTLLPPFVVYKAKNLYDTWLEGGPPGTAYGVSDSGWFEMRTFEQWFLQILLPFVKKLQGPKVLIGDNLASHLSVSVVEKCLENDIRFVFLPPNSTHLTQPLDVAVFRSLKAKWRVVLNDWKDHHYGPLHKSAFPRLLAETIDTVGLRNKINIQSGFRGSGIFPLNPQHVIAKVKIDVAQVASLPMDNVVVKYLEETRKKAVEGTTRKKKKIVVSPGTPVTAETLEEMKKEMSGTAKKRSAPKRKTPIKVAANKKTLTKKLKLAPRVSSPIESPSESDSDDYLNEILFQIPKTRTTKKTPEKKPAKKTPKRKTVKKGPKYKTSKKILRKPPPAHSSSESD